MSGCKKCGGATKTVHEVAQRVRTRPRTGRLPANSGLTRTTAAMCLTCRHHRERSCGLLDLPAMVVVTTRGCPIGRHPDADGTVVWPTWRWLPAWARFRSRGVPAILRLAFLPLGVKDPPGCGCADWLKTRLEQLGERVGWGEPLFADWAPETAQETPAPPAASEEPRSGSRPPRHPQQLLTAAGGDLPHEPMDRAHEISLRQGARRRRHPALPARL